MEIGMNKNIASLIQALLFLVISCILFILGVYIPKLVGKPITLEALGIGIGILLGTVLAIAGKKQWFGKAQEQLKNIKVKSTNTEKSDNVSAISWRSLFSTILLLLLVSEFFNVLLKPTMSNLGSLLLGLNIGLFLVFSLNRLHYAVFHKAS